MTVRRKHDSLYEMIGLMRGTAKRLTLIAALIGLCSLMTLSSCQAGKVAAPVSGYNHTKNTHVLSFSVNGASGPNYAPGGGGGGNMCCVMLPRQWTEGLQVTVAWEYTVGTNGDGVKSRSAVVELPKYSKPGTLNVHFYENNRVIARVSSCDIEHIGYPISQADRAPFNVAHGKDISGEYRVSKEDMIECQ